MELIASFVEWNVLVELRGQSRVWTWTNCALDGTAIPILVGSAAVQGYGFNPHYCETNPTSTDFITSRTIATVRSSYAIHCLYLKNSFSNNFNHFLKINILNVIYSKSKLCILTLYLQLSLRLFRWNGGRAKFLHRLAEKMRAQFVSEVQLWSMAWIKII